MNQLPTSPLTFSNNVIEIGKINSFEIINIYSSYFKINIEPFLKNIPEIKILKCLDTQYMFYYPFEVEGNEKYYELMSKFDWYYNPSRWEHIKALEIINEKDSVLEVGAGSGSFLNQLKKKTPLITGLELNGEAIKEAKNLGLELKKEFVQEHAKTNKEKYNIVCSFQVLEHISKPFEFLNAQLKCLKPKGKMLIGVPNNDSYLKDNKLSSKVLNMPPHHMGLWTLASLKSLENIFNITLKEVYYEPLVGGNVDTYLWNRVTQFFLGISFFTRVIWKFKLHNILRYFFLKRVNKIRGNSMLAIFEKN
jgi:2-polyprenyl-3-methyl-5-hydroxy-6-metoxy-1,4-benzoquinol methylase